MDAKIMEVRLQQWIPLFEAQASSGLTKNEWCKENGIPRWQFFRKQKELRKYLIEKNKVTSASSETGEMLPALVELPIDAPAEAATALNTSKHVSDGQISLSYHGFRISLTGSVDEGTLETLIRSIAHV